MSQFVGYLISNYDINLQLCKTEILDTDYTGHLICQLAFTQYNNITYSIQYMT